MKREGGLCTLDIRLYAGHHSHRTTSYLITGSDSYPRWWRGLPRVCTEESAEGRDGGEERWLESLLVCPVCVRLGAVSLSLRGHLFLQTDDHSVTNGWNCFVAQSRGIRSPLICRSERVSLTLSSDCVLAWFSSFPWRYWPQVLEEILKGKCGAAIKAEGTRDG